MVLDHVILVCIPNVLDEGTYSCTSRLANVYDEMVTLYGNISKKNAQNTQHGFYKNISHGYSSNGNC